jgi:hypothetical protein
MVCKVRGCNNKLNDLGYPIEYCDYQQGKCPMQKKAFDWNNKFDRFCAIVLVPFILIVISVVVYVELF